MYIKRLICIMLSALLAIAGTAYAEIAEIQFDTEVYNLVTTFIGDAKTTRGFAWSSKTDYENMAIRYAKSDDWENAITQSAEYTEFEERLYYKADVTELEPGETYVYKIGDAKKNMWSDFYTFSTEPDKLSEFSFIGVTDPQGSNADDYEYYAQTLLKAYENCEDASFMVNLGDMVNDGNYQSQWDLYFDATKEITDKLPHMAVVGNHEARGDAQTAVKHFSLQFNNPDNGSEALGDLSTDDVSVDITKGVITNIAETIYSFDYGNAHFAVLNSGSELDEDGKIKMMTEQAKWLKKDLDASDKKWKIVMVHIGLYPAIAGRYTTRDELLNVIDECGVDLVLSGHDHVIARTYPMYQNKIILKSNTPEVIKNGTVYNILGAAGTKSYKSAKTQAYMQVYKKFHTTQPTYSVFSINDERIKVVSRQIGGKILDEYTIEKPDSPQHTINKKNSVDKRLFYKKPNIKMKLPAACGCSLSSSKFGAIDNWK